MPIKSKVEIIEAYQEPGYSSPHFNLIAATIERAIKDQYGQDMHVMRDARNWFNSTCRMPFSFLWCCEQLDLPPSEVKRTARLIASDTGLQQNYRERKTLWRRQGHAQGE